MIFNGLKIGVALTGSFCTFKIVIPEIEKLIKQGAKVLPIMSYNAYSLDTKFGKAKDFISQIEDITGQKIIHTIQDAEPIGPKHLIDILIIVPCSGNTIAKLANDITDTPVTMATKSNLRCGNSVVIGVSTNNGLGNNAVNIGKLLNYKNIYFIPFRQDNPITKPNSLVFDRNYIQKTIEMALNKEQIQPILL